MINNGEYVYLDPSVIKQFILSALVKVGVEYGDALIVSDVLSAADLRGIPSHGFARFREFYYNKIKNGLIDPKARRNIIKDIAATAVIDGQNGLGHPIAKYAMGHAITKARKHGIGMVVVRNSNHYGIAGYYAEQAAKQGMIGITGTNARPAVAPTRGVEPIFGTNPIAVAMPSDDIYPFLFDSATTIAQRGKIETYARLKKDLPEGWVVRSDGETLTDPLEALKKIVKNEAALLPLGGILEETGSHKGFGLALVVELLSSALQQGKYLTMLSGILNGKPTPNSLGHFFIAANVEFFCELNVFKSHVGKICKELRASKKAPGFMEILTPGEKEFCTEKKHLEKRGIPFDAQMIEDLLYIRENAELVEYKFPFE